MDAVNVMSAQNLEAEGIQVQTFWEVSKNPNTSKPRRAYPMLP